MTSTEQLLWTRIEQFKLDDPAIAFSFTDRLARENGWSRSYACRVVDEYKKFLFLCCVTKSGVTPPDAVDQAWHLHLTFTQSYWIDLCRNTISREIHHNPTKGGKQEAQKFDGFYTDTHRLYAETFGHRPPADIWPDNQTRFSDIHFQRVNLRRNWVLPKPVIRFGHSLTLAILIIGPLLFIQANSRLLSSILLATVAFVLLIWFISSLQNQHERQGRRSEGGSGGFFGFTGGSDTDTHHHGHDSGHDGDGSYGDGGGDSGCSGCSGSGCGGGGD